MSSIPPLNTGYNFCISLYKKTAIDSISSLDNRIKALVAVIGVGIALAGIVSYYQKSNFKDLLTTATAS